VRISEAIELVTIDVSYISLARAMPQLGRLGLAQDAELVALVKPMFELSLAEARDDDATQAGS
jgi:predicted rRNA methylase YqxC with S4 and FtsJ domains